LAIELELLTPPFTNVPQHHVGRRKEEDRPFALQPTLNKDEYTIKHLLLVNDLQSSSTGGGLFFGHSENERIRVLD